MADRSRGSKCAALGFNTLQLTCTEIASAAAPLPPPLLLYTTLSVCCSGEIPVALLTLFPDAPLFV